MKQYWFGGRRNFYEDTRRWDQRVLIYEWWFMMHKENDGLFAVMSDFVYHRHKNWWLAFPNRNFDFPYAAGKAVCINFNILQNYLIWVNTLKKHFLVFNRCQCSRVNQVLINKYSYYTGWRTSLYNWFRICSHFSGTVQKGINDRKRHE